MPSLNQVNPKIEDFKIVSCSRYCHVAILNDTYVLKLRGLPYLGTKSEAMLSVRLACEGSLLYYLGDVEDLADEVIKHIQEQEV